MGRQWTDGLSVGHGIAVSGAPKQMSNLLGDQLDDPSVILVECVCFSGIKSHHARKVFAD
jgi:hypothetical protein